MRVTNISGNSELIQNIRISESNNKPCKTETGRIEYNEKTSDLMIS